MIFIYFIFFQAGNERCHEYVCSGQERLVVCIGVEDRFDSLLQLFSDLHSYVRVFLLLDTT